MPRYYVKIYEVHSASVEVEANSKEEALELAGKKYNAEELDEAMSLEYIMDQEDWEVQKLGDE